MRVVAFSGSPRPNGNTVLALETVLQPLLEADIQTQIICVGGETLTGCRACGGCKRNSAFRCVQDGDRVNEWIQTMVEADAVILGAPTYFAGIPGPMKCFLDRAFYVNSMGGGKLRMKPAAAVAVARRSGSVCTLDALNHYLSYSEMLLAGSYYWNLAFGHQLREVKKDEEGMQIMKRLGENLLYLLQMRAAFSEQLPGGEPRRTFNYIR